ncbi:NCS2 family permease [Phormidium sp. CCY1219]|uniref:NCS2 family permease n=1 Tax=Phormidium sp. CCY1219 TaxID=2886104 RepID=UPI003FA6A06C
MIAMNSDDRPSFPTPPSGGEGFLASVARFFKFSEHHTTFRTEILAGVTTFMTMAYILAVNPAILSDAIFLQEAGDLFSELAIATALSAAIGTAIMALSANYPFALAPGMGLNAFFTFSVVIGLGIEWRIALAAVFIEGMIFIGLSLSKIRSQIIRALPECIKQATAAGIGLFLAYIALAGDPAVGGAGLIVADPVTKTALGNLNQPPTLMAIAGIVITSALVARRITGALLWGILATAVLGWILGIAAPPTAIVAWPAFPTDLVGQAIAGLSQITRTNLWEFFAVVFVFLFVDLFDTIGTLAGVAIQAGYIKENGELPRANQALMADAIATTVGAFFGTSTVTTYIESAAGVAEGGRTGFTSAIVAFLFLFSLLFIPLLQAIPAFATAPALVIVGVLMAGNVRRIRWDDPAESIPSFLTLLIIPLSNSIAEGLAVGLMTYPAIKAFQGKARETTATQWILAAIFLLRFIYMALNPTE